jgi:hypothetical protein|tara:strand:- start:3266 stop:3472 length:207 start_codon:yes stop_codon:yes gene_type:complete
LKFGPEVEEAQVTLVVTVVLSQSVDTEAVMLPKLLILILIVSIRYVQEAVGLVINHTLAQQVWDAVLM